MELKNGDSFWRRRQTLLFLMAVPFLVSMVTGNPFVRGFVSGFGVIHLIIGVKDIIRISQQRRADRMGES